MEVRIYNGRSRLMPVQIFTFRLSFIQYSTTVLPPYNLSRQKIFIAANFYNNEDILSDFSEQLLVLVQISSLVGPPPENVTALAWSAQFQWLFVIIAYWADGNRQHR